jgi:hypothetical protein
MNIILLTVQYEWELLMLVADLLCNLYIFLGRYYPSHVARPDMCLFVVFQYLGAGGARLPWSLL